MNQSQFYNFENLRNAFKSLVSSKNDPPYPSQEKTAKNHLQSGECMQKPKIFIVIPKIQFYTNYSFWAGDRKREIREVLKYFSCKESLFPANW
jgi:hypothetical protein